MKAGCYTALATPFTGEEVDYEGFENLVDFQIKNGITGILAAGTTGESPVLSWDEHNKVTEVVAKKTKGKCISIAGTGSNNTKETLEGTKHAAEVGGMVKLRIHKKGYKDQEVTVHLEPYKPAQAKVVMEAE